MGWAIRYLARVKPHGREVAMRVFERKVDAVAWEQDQRRRLCLGEWIDPRRGQVPLPVVAAEVSSRVGSLVAKSLEPPIGIEPMTYALRVPHTSCR